MPIARFIGASNAMIVNPITKKSEVFYDFVLRHSLYRPRDLMLIGGKIAQIPAGLRTKERLRAAVDQAAGEIVWHYLAEMRGLTEVPDRSLFGLIPSNVLDRSALKRIAETHVDRLTEKGSTPRVGTLSALFTASVFWEWYAATGSKKTSRFFGGRTKSNTTGPSRRCPRSGIT